MNARSGGYVGLVSLLVVVALVAVGAAYYTGVFNTKSGNTNTPDSLLTAPIQKAEQAAQQLRQADQQQASLVDEYSGARLAGDLSPLLDFNQADYQAALKTDKLIALYFYADWCPICREEVPKLYEAFNQLNNDHVIGFRVNYNDDQTDEVEKALAREHGVAYQHTKVFVKNNQRVLKSPESWDTARYLAEINQASAK